MDNTCDGMWLSLVERFVRDEEAVGSNPVTPIPKRQAGIEIVQPVFYFVNGGLYGIRNRN